MSPILGSYDIWNNELFVGTIDLEITYNYGMFGYGYSNQVKKKKKFIIYLILINNKLNI